MLTIPFGKQFPASSNALNYRHIQGIMKLALPLRLAALATVAFSAFATPFTPAKAAEFGEKEVDQDDFIAVAVPFGENNEKHRLLVIQQKSNKRDCWSTSGSSPVKVDPLLLNFDFTGICGRTTDSNGYSIRASDQDYGLDYLLRIVQRDGELKLVGTPRGSDLQEVVIGSTRGLGEGYLKIFLKPGWEFTKRTYEGETLGHVYFSNDQIALGGSQESPDSPTFPDIANDTYQSKIEKAVARGFVSGFKEDNTFRPEAELTREQVVSMVVEALKEVPNVDVAVPPEVSSSPYPDVKASRWSASKIQWAQENQIISGYPDGTFRPTQPVTRAELVAIERKVAEYAQRQRGQSLELASTKSAQTFSDTSDHWASSLISEMSSYCEVASPLNETGNAFAPDTPAQRNYAAAATLRMLNCIEGETTQAGETQEANPEAQQNINY